MWRAERLWRVSAQLSGVCPSGEVESAWHGAVSSWIVDIAICFLLVLKSWAYFVEWHWMFFHDGAARLRRVRMRRYRRHGAKSYMRESRLAYQEEIKVGRPRLFTRNSDIDSSSRCFTTFFGYLFKTPSLVIACTVGTFLVLPRAPRGLSMIVACTFAFIILATLLGALIGRVTLGPLDQLNPDLGVGRSGGKDDRKAILYAEASPLGRYLLVLLALAVLGFASTYANLSNAAPATFIQSTGCPHPHTSNPLEWLYFAATVGSTVGFGDITAASTLGRTFVIAQLLAGALFITWIAAVFAGEPLPDRDAPEWEWVDRPIPQADQLSPGHATDT